MALFGKNTTERFSGSANQVRMTYVNPEATTALRSHIQMTYVNNAPQSIVDRIIKYELYWHFYHGEHWRENNDAFLSMNYCRAVVNKVNSFLLGPKGFSIQVENEVGEDVSETLETQAEAFVGQIWKNNGGVMKQAEILQMGGVTGDVWVLLQFVPKTYTKDPNDIYLQIQCMDSRQCYPEFQDGDTDSLMGIVFRQPLEQNAEGFLLKCTRITRDTIDTWLQKDTTYDWRKTTKYNGTSNANPYGFIPVVHMQNKTNSSSYYGISDMVDILKLNKVYNELSQTVKEIIDYYAVPTTVVTGGTIKSVTKGVGRIFSGLPSEANVFNLSLGEDLGSTMQFMQLVKTAIHELSDVPENTMGRLQPISNTSAAALQVTYQPLIQQADTKSITYSEGLKKLHRMFFQMTRISNNGDPLFEKLPTDFDQTHSLSPVWVYGLPQDRSIDLQQGEAEIRMGVNSKRGVMNRLGFKNVPSLQAEIKKEKEEDFALQMGQEAAIMKLQNSMTPTPQTTA